MDSHIDNYKRVITSTLNVIEKSIDDFIHLLGDKEKITYEISYDSDDNIKEIINKLNNLREYIQKFSKKYPFAKEKYSLKKILNSKKSTWVIYLEEIKSFNIEKKYSIKIPSTSDYDKDLNHIIEYINSI